MFYSICGISYLSKIETGRIHGISQVLSRVGVLFGRLIAGVLGEYFRYDYIAVIFGIIGAVAVYLIIVKNKESVSYIYNREV